MTNGNLGGATFGQGEYKDEYQPLPVGQYTLAITDTQMKASGQNSKNPGVEYLMIEQTVQGSEYDGRKLFTRLNINNPDDKTKKIAFVELERIATAIGKIIQNHEDLRGTKFLADVVIEEGKNGFGDSNRVKKYYAIGGAVPIQTAPAATSNADPWAQSK